MTSSSPRSAARLHRANLLAHADERDRGAPRLTAWSAGRIFDMQGSARPAHVCVCACVGGKGSLFLRGRGRGRAGEQ